MKYLLSLLSACCLLSAQAVPTVAPIEQTEAQQTAAVKALIERVTPSYNNQYILDIIPAENGQDVYEVAQKDGKVLLRGNNAVALATAFNWYLKYTCRAHLSWFGDQLNLPEKLPLPASVERRVIHGTYRVYMNYCTLSYSAAWWDWKRWQREIDFMAMNGINAPLFMTGLEGVWYNTLKRFKFSDEEARKFLVGPTYFAWQWMQNIQSVGGPLPKSWIDSHIALGKKILERELELGMRPIQQGFSGYVPRELKDKYPGARIKLQEEWCAFAGAAQLDPTDPLFKEIGKAFLEEEKKLFGAHGLYAADPFHESTPPDQSPGYLTKVGQAIHSLFQEHDPQAVWVMQAWSFYDDIVKAVPQENLLILDLDGKRRDLHDNFFGYSFVTGQLNNFGGRINLHGDLQDLANNSYARIKEAVPTVVGTGLFMEAIDQNPVFYDLALEMCSHHGGIDIQKWLNEYAWRRYGAQSDAAARAWKKLLDGPYRAGTTGTENSSIICARPALDVKKSGPNNGFHLGYDPIVLIEAQDLLLQDAGQLKSSSPYRWDIVDIQRQIMSNMGQEIHKKAAQAFQQGDKAAFKLHASRFLQLLKDTDALLRTRPEFNLDKWITDARAWGSTAEEKDLYERNATELVTIWGKVAPDEATPIFDYAWREWTGLIEGYYLKRWSMFYEMLQKYLDQGIPYSEDGLPMAFGRESFRANDFYKKLAEWELKYCDTSHKVRNPLVQGNAVDMARKLHATYSQLAKEYHEGKKVKEDSIPRAGENENLGEAKR